MPKPHPAALAYPETYYPALALPDLSSAEERRRLTAAGLKAFFKIVQHWDVVDEDARELLGGVSNGTYYQWKGNPRAARTLDSDKLTRISYLIGIYKSLNILYSQRLANQWIKLANTNPIFGGVAPLEYILRGGTPAMDTVRRLLDARRGGR
jgi:hypothetical protein